MQTFANWISLPESRSAEMALKRISARAGARKPAKESKPLLLHGPPGSGKSHLVAALTARIIQKAPDSPIASLMASDLGLHLRSTPGRSALGEIHEADVVIIEDIQHLPRQAAEGFVQFLDRSIARNKHVVITSTVGPADLTHLPARLTSRLAQGLVVELEPLSAGSRLLFLKELTRRRTLPVSEPLLNWLAENIGGSARQLEGAVTRMAALGRMPGSKLDLKTIAVQFQVDADAHRPTVERIMDTVGKYFRVEPRKLQVGGKARATLLPRQVGMYLTRQLTELSLRQIGAYFGGRDHSTVLHACRKVEQALVSDVQLSGAVRQLHADLQ